MHSIEGCLVTSIDWSVGGDPSYETASMLKLARDTEFRYPLWRKEGETRPKLEDLWRVRKNFRYDIEEFSPHLQSTLLHLCRDLHVFPCIIHRKAAFKIAENLSAMMLRISIQMCQAFLAG